MLGVFTSGCRTAQAVEAELIDVQDEHVGPAGSAGRPPAAAGTTSNPTPNTNPASGAHKASPNGCLVPSRFIIRQVCEGFRAAADGS